MTPQHGLDEATKAKLLLLLLALTWGLSWPIMKIALDEIGVFTLRVLGYSISTVALFALIRLQGRSASIARGAPRLHVAVSLPVQRHRFRAVQLVRPAHRRHHAGGDHQLLDADLGQPDGLAGAARAPERSIGHRAGAVRRRARRAGLSGGDRAIGHRPAARARLRALLGSRHRLHEMGAHSRRLAHHHGLADRHRQHRVCGGLPGVSRNAGAGAGVAESGSGSALQRPDRDGLRLHRYGSSSSNACRPRPRRSVRSPRPWSASSARC